MSLIQTLRTYLSQNEEMSFVDFMHRALYAPGLGYYSSNLPKLGLHGDFITAPELTPLFGQCLANQCHQIMQALESPMILEYGAGTGQLCVDVLSRLEYLNSLPKEYFILELSANLRHRQKELIEQKIPHLASRVVWLDRLPAKPFNGIILANEVLDAMPVHRFMKTEEGILESFITLNPEDQLVECFKPSTNPRLIAHIDEHLPWLVVPYLSEVNLFLEEWVLNNYQLLHQGVVLLIDYGFPRSEYYHSDRSQGTLMCHHQHKAHPNPLLYPGEQDITAHVDFTHVAESGYNAGFHVAGFTNQAAFLLSNGLLELLQERDNEQERIKATQAIKTLTSPSEMGELFKVMALSKACDIDLNGFQLQDKRVSL